MEFGVGSDWGSKLDIEFNHVLTPVWHLSLAFLLQSELSEYCFVPFGAICLLSALYVGLVLPETKGKSLSAITSEFHKLNFKGQDEKSASQTQAQYKLGEVCLSTSL